MPSVMPFSAENPRPAVFCRDKRMSLPTHADHHLDPVRRQLRPTSFCTTRRDKRPRRDYSFLRQCMVAII